MKTGNEIIAEYMGYGLTNNQRYAIKNNLLKYHSSMNWLYSVYIKIRKELRALREENLSGGQYYHDLALSVQGRINGIESALVSGDIQELHKEIVKGIEFLNEQKK